MTYSPLLQQLINSLFRDLTAQLYIIISRLTQSLKMAKKHEFNSLCYGVVDPERRISLGWYPSYDTLYFCSIIIPILKNVSGCN